VTHKDINKPQDLIGKTVALSGIRTSPYYFFQAFLKKSEINEKDVNIINTGGTADSFRALTSNRVVGTIVTPPFDDKAVSLGYKKFMQLGDLADIPYVGLVTSQNEIKNNRESVRRTIIAVMDSLAWLRAHRAESSKMIVDKFKVNQAEAENTYATLIKLLNKDGRLNPKVARGYLDLLRQERPIPADFDVQKVVDFSMLPQAR
jgi:ABC-type nitrate/sulfonate/bicarbonate transport system substrate-binding protein